MKKLYFILTALFFLIFASCLNPQLDMGKQKEKKTEDITVPENNFTHITMSGYIKDLSDDIAVSGAEISINNVKAISDGNGFFSISADVNSKTDAVAINSDGYAFYQKPLSDYCSITEDLEIFLKPADTFLFINQYDQTGSRILSKDGASVHLPPLSGITEDLEVSLTYFDMNTDDISAVPGDFTLLESGFSQGIAGLGMIDVKVQGDTTGNIYSLEGKGSFEIVIPITLNPDLAPVSISLAYFDKSASKWIHYGSLTKEGNSYTGTVTHFSSWMTYSRPGISSGSGSSSNAIIYGYINDSNLNAVYNITVKSLQFIPYDIPQGTSCLMCGTRTYVVLRSINRYPGKFVFTDLENNTGYLITVKNLKTGHTDSKHIYTGSNAAGQNIGTFPIGIATGINNIRIKTVNKNNINVTWNTGIIETIRDDVEITYGLIGSTQYNTITADLMAKTAVIQNLPYGIYFVSVSTVKGMTKRLRIEKNVKIADYYRLYILNGSASDGWNVKVKINNQANGFYYFKHDYDYNLTEYQSVIILPPGTKITLEYEERLDYAPRFLYWDKTDQNGNVISGEDPFSFFTGYSDVTVYVVIQDPVYY